MSTDSAEKKSFKQRLTSLLHGRKGRSQSRDSEQQNANHNDSVKAVKFSHYPQAQSLFNVPLIAHDNHFLGDLFTSNDSEKPISCGLYSLKPGPPLVYTYTYHEMKIILEGVVNIKDASGQEALGSKGDVFYFPAGSIITFSTESITGVKAFYCGQRSKDGA